ncbi:MAG: ABC transporter permease [Verrucomicrobia bacterium]|nr:ABC transporter permease [Verrucomicrobiota bacterium]
MTPPSLDIRPNQPWWRLEWREIWARRYLWRLLVRKDLLASYKQSLLGPLWFVIQPIISALLFAVVFGKLARLAPTGAPRFLYFLAATVPWTLFQSVSTGVAGSLASNTHILGKVYFPRLIAPLTTAGVSTFHFTVNYIVFMGFYAVYCFQTGYPVIFPPYGMVLVAALAFGALLLGMGTGLWCASLGVRYRDIRIGLPVLLQTWMFATPIIYPSSIIPPAWRPLYFLNPMAGIVETHRHLFFGTPLPALPLLATGAVMILLLLSTSLFVFNRTQRTFVAII